MDKMQEEAMKRVSQMQGANRQVPSHNNHKTHEASESEIQRPSKAESEHDVRSDPADPLSGLFKDKEKLLILILIMLLSEESSNTELVLALLYIII